MNEVRMKCRDKILVFCDSIYPLRVFADLFGYPVLTGSTSDSKRKHDLSDFRQRSDRNVVDVYKRQGYQLPNQQSLVYSTVNVRMVITSHELDEWSRKFASFSQQCSSCAIE